MSDKRSIYDRMLGRRGLAVLVLLGFTGVMGYFASRVKPDYSVEQFFPTFDHSRKDYERFKRDFPFEDARAIVIVEAPDLFQPSGLGRVAALEHDLGKLDGVVDTDGLTSVNDVVANGDDLEMAPLFPGYGSAGGTPLPAAELARRRAIAVTDPLFVWSLTPPDGHATTIRVTLTKEVAAKDATRVAFMHAARKVLARHAALAHDAGATQRLTLNGLPVIRSEFTEMVTRDTTLLFPIALLVILLLLYLTFRGWSDVLSSLITILFSVVWTTGVMGILHVPLQILTQITAIIVMIVSISDTVHIVAETKQALAEGDPNHPQRLRHALVHALSHSAIPCLLTEVTIAGGFLALCTADMVMIQQFGIVTAIGMLLTWVANVTVLPLAMSFLKPKAARAGSETAAARLFARFIRWIEHVITKRGKLVFGFAGVLAVTAALLALRVGKEYYSYDDLRPGSQLARELRYVEAVHGGTVPMAIYIEPRERHEGAMLEPEAIALVDRIEQDLEHGFPEVKNAGSIASYLRKAHRLLAGEDVARTQPLPTTRALVAQELLAIDDQRATRDYLSFDQGTAAVFAMMPDRGSSRATDIIHELEQTFAAEQRAHPGYKITLTGIYGIADGIYRSLVGGLARSLAFAVLISFLIFCLVLRSWRLALVALIPNLLPLFVTIGFMSLLGIDLKPSTVIIFSITLVIADDDTIQYLSRFRTRYLELWAKGHPDPHREAALSTLREAGLPMFVTACAVSAGFLTLLFSSFVGLANLGLLIGVSLLSAVFADLFLSPLLIITLKPRLEPRQKAAAPVAAVTRVEA